MFNKGHIEIGAMYIVVFLFIAIVAGTSLAGGKLPRAIPDSRREGRTFVNIEFPSPQPTRGSLQMYQIYGVMPSVAPTPTIVSNCNSGEVVSSEKSNDTCIPGEDCIQRETFAFRCVGEPGFSLVDGDPPKCMCR